MQLIDLNGPMSLEPRSPSLGRISGPLRFVAPSILFLSFATFGASISRAQNQQDQSVAEAARQERARKQEQQKSAKHVYTEEDLKHPNILTPEDRAQVEAKRNECAQKNNCSPAPSQNPPAALDADSQTPGTSLGEVARQLRKQKELQALKPKQTEPFHLPLETPALATPILPERPTLRPPAQPVLRPNSSSSNFPSNVFRRDPFFAVPVRPEVRRPEVRRPETRPSVREDVRPEIRTDARASVRENTRPTVTPNIRGEVHPKVREDVRPIVRPNDHSDFSRDVRPTLRARDRLTVPVQPKVSSRLGTPGTLIEPMQLSARSMPAEPTAPVAPAVSVQNIVTVQRGDSLWKLAQKTLGRGSRYPELLAVNPRIANPNQIRSGSQLNLPVVVASGLPDRGAKTNAATIITVRKGDTLWKLAKSNLGRSSAWPCLASANPSLSDPNRIYQGRELTLPAACTSVSGNPTSRASPQFNPID